MSRESLQQDNPTPMPQLQDHIEELEGHFYVKDGSGECILYKAAITDREQISKELLALGCFYIDKNECWTLEGAKSPIVDRS